MSSSAAPAAQGSASKLAGKLVIVSGPSGAGKTSICDALLERVPDAVWSVSATTRPPRGQESSGRNYEFITPEEFAARKVRGEFLETAEYSGSGHLYGTPAAPVRQWMSEGKVVVMEIDVQGGVQVAGKVPDSIRVFVLPPDQQSLRARLEGRNTESEAHMAKRLAAADGEIALARDSGCYQYFVTNDILEDTVARIIEIIQQHVVRAR
ncbi:MAG: guanylate kinase [Phycisphaerales bacterium]|nr:guanylate kinase [Phycisphaerales bacterium]